MEEVLIWNPDKPTDNDEEDEDNDDVVADDDDDGDHDDGHDDIDSDDADNDEEDDDDDDGVVDQVEADRMALLSIERNIANMERRWLKLRVCTHLRWMTMSKIRLSIIPKANSESVKC